MTSCSSTSRASTTASPVEDLVATALSYELGTEGMLPGFDEALEGASAGDTRSFTFTPEAGEYEGKEIAVTVVVSTVRERVLPEADDAFAQLASEFDTIEELRDDLRTRLAGVKRLEQGYAAREKVAEALLAATDVPVPDGVIAQQVEEHFSDGHGDDEHRAEFEQQSRDGLKSQLVLDKIAETEDLSVSEAELSSWLVQQAPRYGMSPDQFAQELVNAGQVPAAVGEVRRGQGPRPRPRARDGRRHRPAHRWTSARSTPPTSPGSSTTTRVTTTTTTTRVTTTTTTTRVTTTRATTTTDPAMPDFRS